MKATKDTVVSLRYIMKNEQGEVMIDTMNGTPVDYLHGSGAIMPELEKEVEGMECCQSKSINFTLNQGQRFFMDVLIDNVREASADEIKLGRTIKNSDCGPGCCC